MKRSKATKIPATPAKASKTKRQQARPERKEPATVVPVESKKPTPPPRPSPIFIDLRQIRHLPLLTVEQQAAFDAYEVRPELDVRKMGKRRVKDDLARFLKADVLTVEQVFKLAKDYGIPEANLKKAASATNLGLKRMALGNQLRPRIAKAKR
jgi:hypothetical protein